MLTIYLFFSKQGQTVTANKDSDEIIFVENRGVFTRLQGDLNQVSAVTDQFADSEKQRDDTYMTPTPMGAVHRKTQTEVIRKHQDKYEYRYLIYC